MDIFVDSSSMKEIDSQSINNIGIPSMVLMERAALEVANKIIESHTDNISILAVCGIGNNGGDGICCSRILYEAGYKVKICMIGDSDRCSKETSTQLNIAKKIGIDVVYDVNTIDCSEYDIIIDAIFGIGLCREIDGIYRTAIEMINKANKTVYSVDIPSGVNADNGKIMGCAINASYTITFGVNKKGLILHSGRIHAGEVHVVNIGFPSCVVEDVIKNNRYFRSYSPQEYKEYLPKRQCNSNKGTYGKVLVVAGSRNMAGACYFSAKAAYRTGAGLVQIYTCEDNREILQELVPEAILATYDKDDSHIDIHASLQKALDWCDVVVIGPGLGTDDVAIDIVRYVLDRCDKVKVIDADAINIVSYSKITNIKNAIFTPHLKEMSRLIEQEVSQIQDRQANVEELYYRIKEYGEDIVLVLKDATTLVTDGITTFVNTSGNNGLATAGSGDVLAGIIAGLVAQGMSKCEAGSLGVYIHGICAEYYTERANTYALNATDIIDSLQYVL